jgi:HEPN domain-containing protein
VKKSSENWLKIAEADLRVAKIVLREGEPMAFIFHLHAAIEKILKGIAEENGVTPPKIHNLKQLAIDSCCLKLDSHNEEVLIKLNESFIDSRYPTEIDEFYDMYSKIECEKLFKEVEVTFKWLKSLLN